MKGEKAAVKQVRRMIAKNPTSMYQVLPDIDASWRFGLDGIESVSRQLAEIAAAQGDDSTMVLALFVSEMTQFMRFANPRQMRLGPMDPKVRQALDSIKGVTDEDRAELDERRAAIEMDLTQETVDSSMMGGVSAYVQPERVDPAPEGTQRATQSLLDQALTALVGVGEIQLANLLSSRFERPLPRADSDEVQLKTIGYGEWLPEFAESIKRQREKV